jgi:3-hydroxyisobutyrate dehydrogenase
MNIAFIGLGAMGYPMAGHLLRAGHRVAVYNRSPARARQWSAEFGGEHYATPRQAVAAADLVMICVGNDEAVRSVLYGDSGALAGMTANALVVDHTTSSALLAEELAGRCAELGFAFMDAPVSGGELGAQNGALSIMVGAVPAVFARARPILACYARSVVHLGPPGAGQRCKMVNQICVAGLLQGLAEGINFAVSAGLDIATVVEVISSGAAQSWQLEHRGESMARGDFAAGFALDWMRKDLDICLREARRLGVELPVAALVDGYYAELQQRGMGRCDTSALIARLQRGTSA